MHASALSNAKRFFAAYTHDGRALDLIDIGAQNVNGSLKDVCPAHIRYKGVDFVPALGVDVVLTDPYVLPFESESIDIVVSSSCLEHSEMFWILFLEILRVLKPNGLFFANVPTNGWYHRYPVDCWRFYPDSGQALAKWAKRSGVPAVCLESYVCNKEDGHVWNDYVAVFLKDESFALQYTGRISEHFSDYRNGKSADSDAIINFGSVPEDYHPLSIVSFFFKFLVRVLREGKFDWRKPR